MLQCPTAPAATVSPRAERPATTTIALPASPAPAHAAPVALAADPFAGVNQDALLEDFLNPSHTLATIAQIHNLPLAALLRWYRRPDTQELIAGLRAMAEERASLLEATARSTALAALESIAATQGFALDRLRQREGKDATHAERLRDRETVRKAATELLRLNSPSQREGAGGRARSTPAARPAVPAAVSRQTAVCHAPRSSSSSSPPSPPRSSPATPHLVAPDSPAVT